MQKQLKPKETLLHVFRRLIVPVIVYYFFLSRMLCAFGPFLGFVSGLILNSFDFQIEHGWVDRINFHLFSAAHLKLFQCVLTNGMVSVPDEGDIRLLLLVHSLLSSFSSRNAFAFCFRQT